MFEKLDKHYEIVSAKLVILINNWSNGDQNMIMKQMTTEVKNDKW